jgi:hypothetical protein
MPIKLSSWQRDVIAWLLFYPAVHILSFPSGRPRWSASWSSEEGKKHMVSVMRDLADPLGSSDIAKQTISRRTPQVDRTPRLMQQTFNSLLQRGLIEGKKRRLPAKGWSDMFYYQLSARGKELAIGLVFWQPDKTRADTAPRC